MKKPIYILFLIAILYSQSFSQNITNKVGPNGNFIVTDATGTITHFIIQNSTGNVGIGSNTFDPINPEQLLIDAGVTNSVNAIYAKGTINSYFQFNIRNLSTGTQSSSDIVATANNGTETTYFMDMGVNGSGFIYQPGNPIETGKANDCYILGAGNDLYIVDNNVNKDMIFMTGGTASTNERMRIKNNGRIGIGTTTPSYLLSLSGGAYSNGISWYTSSDSTLKRNIQPLVKYGLNELMKMQPVSYTYKSDSTNKPEIGFIAQEMKNIIPEVVFGKEGEMGITYGNLIPVLVNSIKEQQKKIDDQQKEINSIKEDIKTLKSGEKIQTAGIDRNPSGAYYIGVPLLIGTILILVLKKKIKK